MRPISLTSVFAKVAEDFVCSCVTSDIQPSLDARQYGNVKGASTSHYLVRLVHDLCSAAKRSRNVGTVVLTDFTKAFVNDLIKHNILVQKVISCGVCESIVPWICDFLCGREQCVRFKNKLSRNITLNAGIPQGTTFSGVGFQIMINDAVMNSKSLALKYVDDLSIYENRHIDQTDDIPKQVNKCLCLADFYTHLP
ncbi:uncharacterized protein LOC117120818 [Anneissia japonica]|uniref:uncharacterized protein LOC117120818 n=1 Tax=Anneissia japonica TaxID=1529436 RepID=UPI0014258D07|nr:uncharacterized protein LOC117120818 [Anneissia japonica]